MSIYGYLGCRECRKVIWLGKIVYDENHKPNYFAIREQVTSQDTERVRAIFKMLAECVGHDMRVMDEADPQIEEFMDFLHIGTTGLNEISFEDYLRDWPG